MTYIALKWPDPRLKKGGHSLKASKAFRAMQRLVEARGPIGRDQWGENSLRGHVAQRVSHIIQDSIGWTTDHFVPEDPVDILLWGGTYDLAEGRYLPFVP